MIWLSGNPAAATGFSATVEGAAPDGGRPSWPSLPLIPTSVRTVAAIATTPPMIATMVFVRSPTLSNTSQKRFFWAGGAATWRGLIVEYRGLGGGLRGGFGGVATHED